MYNINEFKFTTHFPHLIHIQELTCNYSFTGYQDLLILLFQFQNEVYMKRYREIILYMYTKIYVFKKHLGV